MKSLLKILACASAVLILVQLAQLLVDVLYERYGKRYIVTSDGEGDDGRIRQPD